MATEKPKVAAADKDGALVEFLVSNRQLIIGGSLLVFVVVSLVAILSQRSQAKEQDAWASFLELKEQNATVDELRAKLSAFEGTDVEPWVLYDIALREYDDENVEDGLSILQRIQSEFPDHYLVRAKNKSGETQIVAGLIDSYNEQLQWQNAHTTIEDNPDPSAEHKVVFKTSEGDIEVGLYYEQSPENCTALLALLPAYQGLVFKTLAGRNLIGGESAEGESDLSDLIRKRWESFPPIEENSLYHFQDAVSFKAPIGADEEADGAILFCLDDNFTEDGRQSVFGRVLSGIQVLQTASEGETDPENPGSLLTPVIIESVEAQIPETIDLESLQAETREWLSSGLRVKAMMGAAKPMRIPGMAPAADRVIESVRKR